MLSPVFSNVRRVSACALKHGRTAACVVAEMVQRKRMGNSIDRMRNSIAPLVGVSSTSLCVRRGCLPAEGTL